MTNATFPPLFQSQQLYLVIANTVLYKSNPICNSRLLTVLSTNQTQSAIQDFCLL